MDYPTSGPLWSSWHLENGEQSVGTKPPKSYGLLVTVPWPKIFGAKWSYFYLIWCEFIPSTFWDMILETGSSRMSPGSRSTRWWGALVAQRFPSREGSPWRSLSRMVLDLFSDQNSLLIVTKWGQWVELLSKDSLELRLVHCEYKLFHQNEFARKWCE